MTSCTKKRDVIALCFWVNARSISNWIIAGLAGVSFSVFFFLPRLKGEHGLIFKSLAFIGGVGGVVAVVFALVLPVIMLMATINFVRRGVIGPKQYTLTESSISENDGHKLTTVNWENVKGVYKTQRFIFVRYSWGKYFILNRRDFLNECEFVEHYAMLFKCWFEKRP